MYAQRAAIAIIDETLHKLGKMHLIYGQPLHLVDISEYPSTLQRPDPTPSAGVPASFIQNVQASKKAAVKAGLNTLSRHSAPKKSAPKPSASTSKPPADSGVASSSKIVSSTTSGTSKATHPSLFATDPLSHHPVPGSFSVPAPSSAGQSSRIIQTPGTSFTTYPTADTYHRFTNRPTPPVAIATNGAPVHNAHLNTFGIIGAGQAGTSGKAVSAAGKFRSASTNAAAGPSNTKRARSPRPSDAANSKKLKSISPNTCPVCQNIRHATIGQCPVIMLSTAEQYVPYRCELSLSFGPRLNHIFRTKLEMNRLGKSSANADIVQELYKIYRKKRKTETSAKVPEYIGDSP